MKKIQLAIITSLLILFAGCSNAAEEQLVKSADEINALSPVDLGNGITINSAFYDDNKFTIKYSVDESFRSMETLRKGFKASKQFIDSYMAGPESNKLREALIAADASYELLYVGNQSKDTMTIEYTPADLKALKTDSVTEKSELEQLEDIIAISAAQCPVRIDGDDFVMTDVAMEGNDLTFRYTFNPEKYNPGTELQRRKEAIYDALQQEMTAPVNALQLKLMKSLGTGVKYVYEKSDGSESIVIEISPDEVKAIN